MNTTTSSKATSHRERTIARAAAVQALFQCEQTGVTPEEVLVQFAIRRSDKLLGFEEGAAPGADIKLFNQLVVAAWEQKEENDEIIKRFLPDSWTLKRLDPVLRSGLRAALTELRMGKPTQVIINEYLDVVNGFSQKDIGGMLNAILDKAAKDFKKEAKAED